jgi:aryl-alcohol dehydrogenase-like predicted oxidoreductase
MKYNLLGNTGVLVSELCLGAMTFGEKSFLKEIGELSQDEVQQMIKASFDKGINFIDTANAYSQGLSESLLGNAIRRLGIHRQHLVIASKLRARMGDGVNQVGLSRLHIADAVNDSLKRLGMDYMDLLYIHGVDTLTSLEETMRGLEDVVRAGKVRYLGVSNHPAWMVSKANGIADKMGWTKFTALQYYYSIAGRDVEREIVPMALSEGLAMMPWSPLAGGFLSGKYSRKIQKTGNSRRDSFNYPIIDKEKAYDIIDLMHRIGEDHQATVAQVALAWLRKKPGVTSIIIGAKKHKQLLENITSAELQLNHDEMDQLDNISALTTEYPLWMIQRQMEGRTPE